MKGKNILLISPEPWNHIFVSKHHYAIQLALRGNTVFFLNPPSRSFSISETPYKNVFQLDYLPFIPGLRYFYTPLQKLFIKKKYDKLQKLAGKKFDVVWSFDNSVFYDFSALPEDVLKICHIVDFNQNFQLAKTARTAHICLGTSEAICERLLKYNGRTYKINHGNNPGRAEPITLPGKQNLKVIYAGNLSIPFIDWETLYKIVNALDFADFVFIGPGMEKMVKNNCFQSICEKPNAFFTGAVDAGKLASYYRAADLLLLCYKHDTHSKQVANPHKMMEYLSSGKIVVSSFMEEFAIHSDLMVMAAKQEELPQLTKAVIDKLDFYNSEELVKKRIAFASDNTYDKQVSRIERIIDLNRNENK